MGKESFRVDLERRHVYLRISDSSDIFSTASCMTENPYQSPAETAPPLEPTPSEAESAAPRRSAGSAIKDGLVIQTVLLLLSMLILDGGRLSKMYLIAMIAHWIVALVILIRRGKSLTRWDWLYIRFGIFPIVLMVFSVLLPSQTIVLFHW